MIAKYPPMGWNSWDCYGAAVNEEQVRANAEYRAKYLKEYGWEYVVVDIQWYAKDAGSRRAQYQYVPFGDHEMDEYGRLLPDVNRFPSAAGGKGFAPLAEYVHSLGLKFGIHIMRGIPRMAAHRHLPVLGTSVTANEIADPSSICGWNPDMYGIRNGIIGAQEYYDSIVDMYADWGVDFIKCDDICVTEFRKPFISEPKLIKNSLGIIIPKTIETRDELSERYGIVKCNEKEFKKINGNDFIRYRKSKYEYEVLVENKKEFNKKYNINTIDKITLEDLMVMMIKGVR